PPKRAARGWDSFSAAGWCRRRAGHWRSRATWAAAPPARWTCRAGKADLVRVLVVDDEVKNAELTALTLRDAGHETAFVNGGEAALRQMEAGAFDAVVTDLRMPRMDGLELMRELHHRWPRAVLVLMTAYGDHDTGRRAMRDGAFAYVHKEGD